jgi:hypothetical protein
VHLCYVDESGSAETYTQRHPDRTPVFVLVGLSVAAAQQKSLSMEFLALKREFEPQLQKVGKQLTDTIRFEVKGSTLRADVRQGSGGRNRRRRAIRFIDKTLELVESHGCRLMGKVIIKAEDVHYTDAQFYPRAVADLANTFNSQLAASGTQGVMILDSRTKIKNEGNVHTITTRRFRTGGDSLPQLAEAPVFGHSDTHVPLQIADIIASAVIFPSACITFCGDDTWSAHHCERYAEIREKFGARIARLEHRYPDDEGLMRGGFQVIDPVGHRPTHLLFRD